MFKLLHRILFNMITWITPVVIIFYSIILGIANPNTYKEPLQENNFYYKLSKNIKIANYDGFDDSKETGVNIATNTILDKLVTDQWLKTFFEKNIDLLNDWLKDNNDSEIIFFLPARNIDQIVFENIDQEILNLVEENEQNVPTCSDQEEERILIEGYSENQRFCLPETVKTGQVSFTSFLGYENFESYDNLFLEKLFDNNFIDPERETFKLSSLEIDNEYQETFLNTLDSIKNLYHKAKEWLWPSIIFASLGLIILILLSHWIKKPLARELRQISWITGVSTLVISGTILAIFWLIANLNSLVIKWLLSDMVSEGLANGTITEITAIGFKIISPAIWIGLSLLGLAIIFWFLEKFVFSNIKSKNKKILNYQNSIDPEKSQSFDSQFKQKSTEEKFEEDFEENSTKQNFIRPTNPDDNQNKFNADEIPEEHKIRNYDESLWQESVADPDINNPELIEGIDYQDPEDGENSKKEIGDKYFPRIDQDTLEIEELEDETITTNHQEEIDELDELEDWSTINHENQSTEEILHEETEELRMQEEKSEKTRDTEVAENIEEEETEVTEDDNKPSKPRKIHL